MTATTDQLPTAVADEREVLCAMLIYPECATAGAKLLSESHFFDEAYRAVASEIIRQERSGHGIDPQLVARNLNSHPAFPDGAASLVAELRIEYASRHQFPVKCAAIVEAYRKRQRADGLRSLLHAAMNGSHSYEIDQQVIEATQEWQNEAAGFGQSGRYTFADLRHAYPNLRPPVVHDLAREAETLNLISTSKTGKTCFVGNLAICQITERPFLGRFNTTGGRVLVLDNELHRETIVYRYRMIGDALGVPPEEYENDLVIWPLRGKLPSIGDLAAELAGIQRGEFSIIIWDSKYRFATPGASENDNASETLFYNIIDEVGDRTGALQVLVHHSSKGDQSGKRITDVGSGAGAQSRAADCHVVLREHEEPGVVVMEAAVRSFAPVEPLCLRWQFPLWVPDSGADPERLRRQPSQSDQRQAARDKDGTDQIVKALLDGPATARQLRSRTGISRERLERLICIMESDGNATHQTTNIEGNSCDEYKLCE